MDSHPTTLSAGQRLKNKAKTFFAKKRHFPFLVDVERINFLTDAVIAIAITLLVVDITVPHRPKDLEEDEFDAFISDFLVKTAWYIGSYYFVVVTLAGYWFKHLWIFCALKEADSTISLFNVGFLLFISFTPFTFKVARVYLTQFYTWMIIFGSLFMTGLCLLLLWVYASFRRKWVHGEKKLPSETLHVLTLTIIFPVLVHAICIGLSATNFIVPIIFACTIPLYYVLSALKLDFIELAYKGIAKCFKRKNTSEVYGLPRELDENDQSIMLEEEHGHHAPHDSHDHDDHDEHGHHDESFIDNKGTHPFWDKKHFHHEILERMALFSDGVFSIVITILVLEMKPPKLGAGHGDDHSASSHALDQEWGNLNSTMISPWVGNDDLGHGLAHIWPEYVSFLVSVVLVASFWKHHVSCMQGLKKANKLVLLVNLLFLATIALIPFGSNFLSVYHDRVRSAVVYNAILLGSGTMTFQTLINMLLAFFLLILFALCHFSHLAKDNTGLMKLRWRIYEFFRTIVIMIICAISLGIAFVE
jgi:uncharacterized membrane protein